jgi:ketosteroid isomerase-like protein
MHEVASKETTPTKYIMTRMRYTMAIRLVCRWKMTQTIVDIEREVTALDDQRLAAVINDDLAALEKLLADDLVYIHTSSATDTKEVFLGKLKGGELKYQKCDLRERRFVALSDSVALLTGRIEFDIISGGTPKLLNNMFINVWAKRHGSWQMVSWQSTGVPTT